MSGLTRLEMCGNVFNSLSDTAQGLCALGDALKALDVERIEDQGVFLSGIGHLVNTVGVQILDMANHSQEITREQAA